MVHICEQTLEIFFVNPLIILEKVIITKPFSVMALLTSMLMLFC